MSKPDDVNVCDIIGHPVILGVCVRCGVALSVTADDG